MKKIFLFMLSVVLTTTMTFGQRDYSTNKVVKKGTQIVKGAALNGSKGKLFESFEGSFPPAGWTKVNPDGGSGWAQIEDGTSPLPGWQGGAMTISDGGGTKAVYCTWNTGGQSYNEQWLITPAIDISAGDTLKFKLLNATEYVDNLDILLSTTDVSTASFTEVLEQITFSAPADWTEYKYDLSAYDGQTVYIAFKEHVENNNAQGSFLGLDLVQIGEITEADAVLTSLNIPGVADIGAEINVKGSVMSNGSNITGFDVTYNVDGGTESAVFSVTDIDVPLGESYEFTHDVPCVINDEGTHTINVTISNVNGGGETNLSNNSLAGDVVIAENSVPRTVLIEQFTTEKCGKCPPVIHYIENIVDNNDNVILMSHHTGFGTDFLTIPVSTQHLDFFNGGTYCPAGMFDRHYNGLDNDDYQGPDPGPVFWDGNPYGGTKINERLATPAYVTVNINGTENDNGEFEITVSGEFTSSLTHDMGVSLWITEDHINAQSQNGAGSDFVHRFTVRDAISDRLGDPITTATNEGDTYTRTYTYTPNSAWNAEELYLVALVGDMNASDVNDRTVLNAVQVKLSDLEPLATCKVVENNINIYPNPAKDYVTITNVENSEIIIYNILGEMVYKQKATQNNTTINISELQAGNYIIKVVSGNVTKTEKLNVIR